MPKINKPFVPQQPGAGTDNYIDGGPTRAGLEELRGKVNAAPTTWATVAEAEAANYTEPESVVVTETGRTYTYSANSNASRDGIRVLAPAGGGRLLAVKTGSDDVEVPKIGTPDHQSLTQSLQVGLSAGACNGNFVTDAGGGTINIASGEGMIRATNSSDSAIFAFRWPEVNGVTIPLNSVRYVGVEYNSGNPQAVVRTTNNWNGQTEFQAATVVNEDGTLHILNNPQETCDGIQKIFHRLIETQPFQFAERIGGGRFSEVGTRNLSLSPCEFYDGLNEFPVTAKDTSTGDTFDAYYGNFTKIAAQTQWDNQNYDNAGTLTALSANRYGVHWLYIEMDDSFALVYGKGNYNTISDAEAALPPASLPLRLSLGSRLAAKLIFQKGASSVIRIESAFDVNFQSGMPVSHGDLSDIRGNGDHHLSEAERDAAIRLATASQSGLMSAAYASKLDGISASADATGFLGNYTTSQIAALTGMSAGNWVRDSSLAYRPVVYNGTFWLPPGHVVLQNRTGASSVAGTAVQLSASYDFAVELPNIAESDADICGIMVSDGVANGSDVVVDVLGSYFSQVLVVAGDSVVSGYYMVGRSDGLFISRSSARLGSVGRALETKTSASNFLVWVLTSGNETV